MSDIDYRVLLTADATVEDWIVVDHACGEIHQQLARAHRQWWRILEHTPGAGQSDAELLDERRYHPELRFWHVAHGSSDLLKAMIRRFEDKPWEYRDELYHLKRLTYFYSPYQQGIDPPINLAGYEREYDMHSRCWHYFAPAMLSVASLLRGRGFEGKRAALNWLGQRFPHHAIWRRVIDIVDARYDVAETTNLGLRAQFDEQMFDVFKDMLGPVRQSLRFMAWPVEVEPVAMKQQLQGDTSVEGAMMALTDAVRFARIRLGRYLFYIDPPEGFDAGHALCDEAQWLGVAYRTPLQVGAAHLDLDAEAPPERVFSQIVGRALTQDESTSLKAAATIAATQLIQYDQARQAFHQFCPFWLNFYRLLEEYAQNLFRLLERDR